MEWWEARNSISGVCWWRQPEFYFFSGKFWLHLQNWGCQSRTWFICDSWSWILSLLFMSWVAREPVYSDPNSTDIPRKFSNDQETCSPSRTWTHHLNLQRLELAHFFQRHFCLVAWRIYQWWTDVNFFQGHRLTIFLKYLLPNFRREVIHELRDVSLSVRRVLVHAFTRPRFRDRWCLGEMAQCLDN